MASRLERRGMLLRSDLRSVPLGHLLIHLDFDDVPQLNGCALCAECERVNVNGNQVPQTERPNEAFSALTSAEAAGGDAGKQLRVLSKNP